MESSSGRDHFTPALFHLFLKNVWHRCVYRGSLSRAGHPMKPDHRDSNFYFFVQLCKKKCKSRRVSITKRICVAKCPGSLPSRHNSVQPISVCQSIELGLGRHWMRLGNSSTRGSIYIYTGPIILTPSPATLLSHPRNVGSWSPFFLAQLPIPPPSISSTGPPVGDPFDLSSTNPHSREQSGRRREAVANSV